MKALAALVIAVLSVTAFPGGVSAQTEHCPNHNGHPGKVEGKNNSLVLPLGSEFCVKGSTDATGILIADGKTTLVEYLRNGHDVSYYILYKSPATTTTTEVQSSSSTTVPPTSSVPEETTTTLPGITSTTTVPLGSTTTSPGTTAPTTTAVSDTSTSSPTTSIVAVDLPPIPKTREELPETGGRTWTMAVIATMMVALGLTLRRVRNI